MFSYKYLYFIHTELQYLYQQLQLKKILNCLSILLNEFEAYQNLKNLSKIDINCFIENIHVDNRNMCQGQ